MRTSWRCCLLSLVEYVVVTAEQLFQCAALEVPMRRVGASGIASLGGFAQTFGRCQSTPRLPHFSMLRTSKHTTTTLNARIDNTTLTTSNR